MRRSRPNLAERDHLTRQAARLNALRRSYVAGGRQRSEVLRTTYRRASISSLALATPRSFTRYEAMDARYM